jgi:hypothetical protein
MRSWTGLVLAGSLALTAGCQTYLGGMTLPSNDYLRDNPDYIQPMPNFKLPREAAAQQAAARNLVGTPVVVPGANNQQQNLPVAPIPAVP